jgi:TraB/PrgY/gumN family
MARIKLISLAVVHQLRKSVRWTRVGLASVVLGLLSTAPVVAQLDTPEEIVVTGRLPGPALWKVSNGEDHALWIFAYLSPIPRDMIWESERVEKVIAGADEYLEPPGTDVDVSPLVLLNPLTYIRGMRLGKRLSRNPDDKKLDAVLPPALYQRFANLQAKYFPDETDINELRPLFAAQQMAQLVQRKNELGSAQDIMKKIQRLVRRQRGMETTSTEVSVKLEGGYGTLAKRAEAMMDSLPLADEIRCMEFTVTRMESELEAMKSRANSWAQGYVDDFQDVVFRGDENDPCFMLMLATSETATFTELRSRSEQQWLAAASKALATNQSTFAVLNISELITPQGLLAQLKAQGYTVREP